MSLSTRRRPRSFRPRCEEGQHHSLSHRLQDNTRTDLPSPYSTRLHEPESLRNRGQDPAFRSTQSRSRVRRLPSMPSHPTLPHRGLGHLSISSSMSGIHTEPAGFCVIRSLSVRGHLGGDFVAAVTHPPQRQYDIRAASQSSLDDNNLCRILGSIRTAIDDLSDRTVRNSGQTLLDEVRQATVERIARGGGQRARLADHSRHRRDTDPAPPYAEDEEPPPAYYSLFPRSRR